MIRFLATLLLLVAWSIAPAQAQQWVQYKPAGAGFLIEFPTAPTIETETIPSDVGPMPTTTAESTVEGEAIYLVSYSVFPANVAIDPSEELDGARKGLLESSKTKLRRERRLTMDGLPARRLVLASADNNVSVVALLVCSRERLYSAAIIVPLGEENGDKVERFLKSFTLLPK
jgi:hypothetical protein